MSALYKIGGVFLFHESSLIAIPWFLLSDRSSNYAYMQINGQHGSIKDFSTIDLEPYVRLPDACVLSRPDIMDAVYSIGSDGVIGLLEHQGGPVRLIRAAEISDEVADVDETQMSFATYSLRKNFLGSSAILHDDLEILRTRVSGAWRDTEFYDHQRSVIYWRAIEDAHRPTSGPEFDEDSLLALFASPYDAMMWLMGSVGAPPSATGALEGKWQSVWMALFKRRVDTETLLACASGFLRSEPFLSPAWLKIFHACASYINSSTLREARAEIVSMIDEFEGNSDQEFSDNYEYAMLVDVILAILSGGLRRNHWTRYSDEDVAAKTIWRALGTFKSEIGRDTVDVDNESYQFALLAAAKINSGFLNSPISHTLYLGVLELSIDTLRDDDQKREVIETATRAVANCNVEIIDTLFANFGAKAAKHFQSLRRACYAESFDPEHPINRFLNEGNGDEHMEDQD